MRAFLATAMPDNPINLAFLLLFVAIFAGVAIFHLRPSRKALHERAARMPFND